MLLADSRVALALSPKAEHQLFADDLVQVVEADRNLEPHGHGVRDVDERVDPRKRLALLEPAQQRLGRRPDSRRIDAEAAVQRARSSDVANRTGAHGLRGSSHLELEVVAWLRHLQLVQLHRNILEVQLRADLQRQLLRLSASSWSKKPGYEISAHSAPATSVSPFASDPAMASAIATRWSP